MGLLERHGKNGHSTVRASVVPNTKQHLEAQIHAHVEPGSPLYTDSLPSYKRLAANYEHQVVDHAECYVKGRVHTNGCENVWSLLKRAIKGTYVSVEPFHLFRHLD